MNDNVLALLALICAALACVIGGIAAWARKNEHAWLWPRLIVLAVIATVGAVILLYMHNQSFQR